MNIAVVLRQVPDLIEPLEVAASGAALDLGSASFVLNESDDHALEQALLLKEAVGGTVTAVALDFGDVDNTLYAAAAKGVDRIIKLSAGGEDPLPLAAAAAIYAGAIKPLGCDLVLVGVQAHDEFEGVLPPLLAAFAGFALRGRDPRREGRRRRGDRVEGVPWGGDGAAEGEAAGRVGDRGRGAAAPLCPRRRGFAPR